MNKKIVILVFVAEIIAILFLLFFPKPIPFGSDQAVYIESARNLREGKGLICLALDSELMNGDLEPLSLFPPGYPILIYSLALFGVDVNHVAVTIPKIAFLLLPIMFFLVFRYVVSDMIAIASSIFSSFMFHTVFYAFLAYSDTPFLTMVLISIFFLFKSIDKKNLIWAIISGLLSGFSLLIRNVGYSLILAVFLGFVIAFIFGLLEKKLCFKILSSYIAGFFISYVPLIFRNIVVFNSIQPYSMPPSDLTFFDNVYHYFFALSSSFFNSGYYRKPIIFSFLFLFGINLFYLLKDKSIIRKDKYSKIILYSMILFLYAAFGSLIVVLARTKYKWGEIIHTRHLIQYNWIFVVYFMSMGIFVYNKIRKILKFSIKPYAIVLVGYFVVYTAVFFYCRTITLAINNYYEKNIFNKAEKMVSYVSNLPKNTYIVSNYGPWLRILTKRSVGQICNSSPQELAKRVSSSCDIIVILFNDAGKSFKDFHCLSWMPILTEGNITEGYKVIKKDSLVIVLFCPKAESNRL